MSADVYYSAEFVVSFEKLKKGVAESHAALEKLEGELGKSGKPFEKMGNAADKAKEKISGIAAAVKKSNNENEKSSETFFSAFKKGWRDATDTAGEEAVNLGKTVGAMINPLSIGLSVIAAAAAFMAKKVKEVHDNWKNHNELVKQAAAYYDALNGKLTSQNELQNRVSETFENALKRMNTTREEYEAILGVAEELRSAGEQNVVNMVEAEVSAVRQKHALEQAAKAAGAFTSAMEEYQKSNNALRMEIDNSLHDNKSYQEALLSRLIEQRVALGEANDYNRENVAALEKEIKLASGRVRWYKSVVALLQESGEESEKTTKELSEQEKITNAINKAEERYNEAIAKTNAERDAGILDEQQAAAARAAAMAAWKDALQGIVDEYNLTEGETVKLLKQKRAIVGEAEKQRRSEEKTGSLRKPPDDWPRTRRTSMIR
jgi:hypothetical protein